VSKPRDHRVRPVCPFFDRPHILTMTSTPPIRRPSISAVEVHEGLALRPPPAQSVNVILPISLLTRLRTAIEPEFELKSINIVEGASLAVGEDAQILVVDPILLNPNGEDAVLRLVSAKGAGRIIVYTSLSREGVIGALAFVRAGVRHVLISNCGDHKGRIRQVIEDIAGDDLTEKLLARLSSRLVRLPAKLSYAVVDAVLRPDAYAGVSDLCKAAAVHRRSCDRWFAQSGLTSLNRLVQAARVVRAASLLRKPRLTLAMVAVRVGAPSPAALSAEIRRVLELTPRRAVARSDEEILSRVLAFVCGTSSPGQD
jgi:AraC-like DNA-binding protein